MRNTQTQSTTQETAARLYAARYAEAQDLLKRIALRLEEHKTRQEARNADWGYAGDLGRITEQLANVLAGLGDASAAGAKGLAY
jgi:epoxyqueuosine reductase QueG